MSQSINYSILIHYSEIALKLNNRSYFERTFIENIKGSPKIWGAYKRLPEEYKIYGKKFGSSPYQVGRLKDAYYAYEMYK